MLREFQKLKPMLAKMGTIHDLKRKAFIYELFYGGTRALLYKSGEHIRLLNRKGTWIEFRYPELLELYTHIDAKSAILDGEIVVLDSKGGPSFSSLERREHLAVALDIEMWSKKTPATFVAFDIVMKNGRWINDQPLYARKKLLEETVKQNSLIRLSRWTKNGSELFKEAKKNKLEGVIGKNVNTRYEFGARTNSLLKIKARKTIDCVVVGWKEKKEGIGSLALGIYKELHLYYMGTVDGLSDEFVKIWAPRLHALRQKKPPVRNPPEGWQEQGFHWLKPNLVCEVEYDDITKAMEIKKPVLIRMRSDKEPQSCTLSEQVKLR